MSLIFGAYCKKHNIDDNEFKEVFEDFSLNKTRELQTKIGQKTILSALKSASDCIVENEDNSLIILFSGAVYDFDYGVHNLINKGHKFKNENNCAEFILHAYEEFGESFLKEINGIFAFAIYNRSEDELILANDSFGQYPLFVYNTNDYCIFSTEYEPIIKYKKFNTQLNYDAVTEYFTLGLPLGDKTFFKYMNNLSPGSILKINRNDSNIQRYDDLNIQIDRDSHIDDFAQKISETFRKAVQARVKNLTNIKYADLTAGVDTRLILSNLTKEQRASIQFFTEYSPSLKESEDREVMIAKMLAEKSNLNHKISKAIPPEDYVFTFFDRRRERSSQKILSGACGGEFLGGTCLVYAPINIGELKKEKSEHILKYFFDKSFLEKISNPYLSLKKELKNISAENKQLLFSMHQFTRGYFTNIYGETSWLSPHAHWTQYDSPFCDTNFLKLLLTVPKEYLADYELYNLIYKNHHPEFIQIPTNNASFTKRAESCIDFISIGIKHPTKKPDYYNIIKSYLQQHSTWNKNVYNSKYIKTIYYSKKYCDKYTVTRFCK
jgi:asparagine synthetase B (glutamine-hydrolysing)